MVESLSRAPLFRLASMVRPWLWAYRPVKIVALEGQHIGVVANAFVNVSPRSLTSRRIAGMTCNVPSKRWSSVMITTTLGGRGRGRSSCCDQNARAPPDATSVTRAMSPASRLRLRARALLAEDVECPMNSAKTSTSLACLMVFWTHRATSRAEGANNAFVTATQLSGYRRGMAALFTPRGQARFPPPSRRVNRYAVVIPYRAGPESNRDEVAREHPQHDQSQDRDHPLGESNDPRAE
jgi:hypothetical protein